MEPVLVSAGLHGVPCRFDGRGKASAAVAGALADRWPVAFCREVAAGVTTPRRSAEIVGGDGHDVLDGTFTGELREGDCVTAALLERHGITVRAAPGG